MENTQINIKRNVKEVIFDEIVPGQCFEYQGVFYIRVDNPQRTSPNVAVNLQSGMVEDIHPASAVNPVKVDIEYTYFRK